MYIYISKAKKTSVEGCITYNLANIPAAMLYLSLFLVLSIVALKIPLFSSTAPIISCRWEAHTVKRDCIPKT